nr:MAG: rep protein [Cressdnaviricota sp.]
METDHNIRSNDRQLNRKRSRAWFGTIWDPVSKEFLKELTYKYLIISDDDHTQQGELHWHCLVTFNQARPFPRIDNIHWEAVIARIGARNYCLDKGPNYFQDGDLTIADQNTMDWDNFVEYCKTHGPKEQIDGPYSKLYAQYRGFAGEVHNQFAKVEILDGELQNQWLWGEAGTGKTRTAWEQNPNLYVKSINKWWDGYNDQETVLLDDWDPKHEILTQHLKTWADRYPFRAETKGSSMMIRPKKIIVTSNYSIDECFPNPEDANAIKRRFHSEHFSRLREHQ